MWKSSPARFSRPERVPRESVEEMGRREQIKKHPQSRLNQEKKIKTKRRTETFDMKKKTLLLAPPLGHPLHNLESGEYMDTSVGYLEIPIIRYFSAEGLG
jgi:hypothetical protein